MIKRPLEESTDDEKFSRYVPTIDLSDEEAQQSDPIVLPLSGLPPAAEQATDKEH